MSNSIDLRGGRRIVNAFYTKDFFFSSISGGGGILPALSLLAPYSPY